jgi:hypothetical protein
MSTRREGPYARLGRRRRRPREPGDGGESLIASLRAALDRQLSDAADIRDVETLERALAAYAVEVSATIIASADYAVRAASAASAVASGRRGCG